MKYFGTDGIRGVFGRDLTENLGYKVGLAASQMFETAFVGMDTRVSSEALCEAVMGGLVDGGCNVNFVGMLPTPAVAYLSHKYGCGGAMITASHNAPEYNGIKLFFSGFKLNNEGLIEHYIDEPPLRTGEGNRRVYDGKNEYLNSLSAHLEGISVTLDCAHGATCKVAVEAFERAGAKVKAIFADGDGSKINCGCGALFPQPIKNAFFFDGDGDRVVASDGKILDGDSALYTLAVNPRGVVGTVMANSALEYRLAEDGIPFVRTAVGDKNVAEAMRAFGYDLGGEQSGHYIMGATTGDGIRAALALAGRDEFKRLKLIPQFECAVEGNFIHPSIKRVIACLEREKIRAVVRKSGTEPKIRIMTECENEEAAQNALKFLADRIKEVI